MINKRTGEIYSIKDSHNTMNYFTFPSAPLILHLPNLHNSYPARSVVTYLCHSFIQIGNELAI